MSGRSNGMRPRRTAGSAPPATSSSKDVSMVPRSIRRARRACLSSVSTLALGITIACLAVPAQPAAAQTIQTYGPSLTGQRFEQVDANGVDVINGTFTTAAPALVGGTGRNSFTYQMRWNGKMWSLPVPSIWRDEDNSLFINTGRMVEQFDRINGIWVPASGNTSHVSCTFWDSNATQLSKCDYGGHDGSVAHFWAPSPYAFPPAFAPFLGNIGAGSALVAYPDGTFVNINNEQSDFFTDQGFRMWAAGLDGTTSTVGMVTGSNQAFERGDTTIGILRLSTPGVTSSNRFNVNALHPKSTTQTITDPSGQVWTYTFNGDSNMTSIRRPGSYTNNVTVTYDSNKKVSSYSNGYGTWYYRYSLNNGIGTTVVTDPTGRFRTITWVKKKGYARSVTDESNRTTNYAYDASNRLTSITFPELNRVEYLYDARGNVIQETRYPKPGTSDPVLIKQAGYPATCPDGGGCNQPDYVIDPNGNRTDYIYYGALLASVTQPAPVAGAARPQTRYTWTELAPRTRKPDGTLVVNSGTVPMITQVSECRTTENCQGTADEVRTTIDYGPLDSVNTNLLVPITTTVSTGDGAVVSQTANTADAVGNVTSTDGPLPGSADTSYMRYDSMRRLVGSVGPDTDGSGPLPRMAVRNTYSADGLQTGKETGTVTGPSDAEWQSFQPVQIVATSYDSAGRPVQVAEGDGTNTISVTQTSYDPASRPLCTAVRMNSASFPLVYAGGYAYGGSLPADACQLDVAGAAGTDRIERKGYTDASELRTIERGVGTALAQTYAYYTYTPNGKQASVQDADGNLATMTYDGHDRQIRWDFPSKTAIGQIAGDDFETYQYDSNGNRTVLTKRDGRSLGFSYDALNRVTQKTILDGSSPNVFYGYDNQGHQTYVRFGSAAGAGITTTYDPAGHPATSTNTMGGFSRTLSYLYDAAGNRTRVTHPDGTFFTYNYDWASHLTSVLENGSSMLVAINYDSLGRRNGASTGNGLPTNSLYQYDGAGRLSSMSHNVASGTYRVGWDFTYNPASQIASRNISNDLYAFTRQTDVSRAYGVNGLNQYTQAGGAIFSYDRNGNLTGDGTNSFGYDIENRLISASIRDTQGNVTTPALSYDPNGRLFQVSGGAGATQFLYDGDALVAEYDSAGNVLKRYVHGSGSDEPFVWYEGAGLTDRRYLVADHQGSNVLVTDSNGYKLYLNSYDPWGIPGANNNGRFQYTGQIWLPELGLYHYKARIYSPTLGRFLQSDPVGYKDQVNLYAYVGNDPVNGRDPTGENQEQAAQWAYSHWGSRQYREDGLDTRVGGTRYWIDGYGAPKCNFFVYDALSAGRIAPRSMNGDERIPRAQDWGNRNSKIDGWRPLAVDKNGKLTEPVAKGDVVGNGGHVGIIVGLPYPGRQVPPVEGRPVSDKLPLVASAGDRDHGDKVTLTNFGFRPDDGRVTIWRPFPQ